MASCTKNTTEPLIRFLKGMRQMNVQLSSSMINQMKLADLVFTRPRLTTTDILNYAKTMHNLTIKVTLTYLKFPAILELWSKYNNWYYVTFRQKYGAALENHLKKYGERGPQNPPDSNEPSTSYQSAGSSGPRL